MHEIRIGHWTKFGAAVRDARRAQSLSQTELAERAGVSRSWLAKLESGHRGAEFEQILRVMSALGLTLSIRDDRPEASSPSTELSSAVGAKAPASAKPTSSQPTSSQPTSSKSAARIAAKSSTGGRKTRTPARRKSSGAIRIRVADTGPAVSAAAVARLLDRHKAALEDRRSTWDSAALKVTQANGG